MRSKKLFVLAMLSCLLVMFFACSKKQTVQTEPVVEDVVADIPPVEEETPIEEPVVIEEKMPVLGDVFFDFDKYGLSDESKRTLERNTQELKDAMSRTIFIEGHCDERGTVDYNMALGEKRAKAAMDYLVSLGISAGRIEVVSYGKAKPFDSRHNEDAWAKNRRAHFIVEK